MTFLPRQFHLETQVFYQNNNLLSFNIVEAVYDADDDVLTCVHAFASEEPNCVRFSNFLRLSSYYFE